MQHLAAFRASRLISGFFFGCSGLVCYGQRLCGRGRAVCLSAGGSAWYRGRYAPTLGSPVVFCWVGSVLFCLLRQLVRDLLIQLDRGLDGGPAD